MGVAAILGLILPAIPGLIDMAEKLISAPKSGETKISTVLQSLRALISGITATTPPVPGAPAVKQPTDEELRAVIETIFAQKKAGPEVAPSGKLWLVQGTVTELTPKP